MARIARSVLGTMVDFDLLAIRTELAAQPITITTEERRLAVDHKLGVRRPEAETPVVATQPETIDEIDMDSPLAAAQVSIVEQKKSKEK